MRGSKEVAHIGSSGVNEASLMMAWQLQVRSLGMIPNAECLQQVGRKKVQADFEGELEEQMNRTRELMIRLSFQQRVVKLSQPAPPAPWSSRTMPYESSSYPPKSKRQSIAGPLRRQLQMLIDA